jgi:hypothetical protein
MGRAPGIESQGFLLYVPVVKNRFYRSASATLPDAIISLMRAKS